MHTPLKSVKRKVKMCVALWDIDIGASVRLTVNYDVTDVNLFTNKLVDDVIYVTNEAILFI